MPHKNRRKKQTGLNKVWADGKTANVVGLLVRKLRRERGLTQEQLSAQCQVRGLNLTRGTLAKIEARLRFIKACELFIIARVMNVPMEHFYPPGFGDRRSP
jgi:transcriptional regulator with XRE-family HTH domain